jgi:hypothetical protein
MRSALAFRVAGLAATLIAAGCASTRSISDSGFGYYGHGDLYRGELSEFDVLGIDPTDDIPEARIAESFARPSRVRMPEGSAVLLIQSGALFPDEPLQRALARHYAVAPLSGRPVGSLDEPEPMGNFSRALRLAAAQGGYAYIVVVWGVLEAQQKDLPTRGVSWVPFLGKNVPDQTQRLRLRLKAIVLDARSGEWGMLAPEPVESRDISARSRRVRADEAQVEDLKEQAYARLVEEIVATFES